MQHVCGHVLPEDALCQELKTDVIHVVLEDFLILLLESQICRWKSFTNPDISGSLFRPPTSKIGGPSSRD